MSQTFHVTIGGETFDVTVDGETARVGDRSVRIDECHDGVWVASSEGASLSACLHPSSPDRVVFSIDQGLVDANVESERDRLRQQAQRDTGQDGPCELHSQIPGVIRRVMHEVGDTVCAGEAILTLEAMKMENEVCAEQDGTLVELRVCAGDTVEAGQLLAIIENA